MPKITKKAKERSITLASELEAARSQLYVLIGGERQRLSDADVYQMSVKLDDLILKYMRAFA